MIRNPVKLNRTNNYKKANLVILEDIQTVKCCIGENVVVAFFYFNTWQDSIEPSAVEWIFCSVVADLELGFAEK